MASPSGTLPSSSTPTAIPTNTIVPEEPSTFLSFPSSSRIEEPEPQLKDPSQEKKKKQLLKDRLYVGNLHPTVDEYTLLTLFGKYGTITSLDYLFHKTGPSKGKPRGFAFVEFEDETSASKAHTALNDKLLRGRKLVVTFAHQAPQDDYSLSSQGGVNRRKPIGDSGKPTTLSLLKSGRRDPSNSKDKIALMEAKLRQMEASSKSPSPSIQAPSAHPSLPPKPPAPSVSQPQPPLPRKQASSSRNIKQPLPSLPMLPMSSQTLASSLTASYTPSSSKPAAAPTTIPSASSSPKSTTLTTRPKASSRSSMLGIKIVRKDH